jgi:Gamma-glutamyltranspeptidase
MSSSLLNPGDKTDLGGVNHRSDGFVQASSGMTGNSPPTRASVSQARRLTAVNILETFHGVRSIHEVAHGLYTASFHRYARSMGANRLVQRDLAETLRRIAREGKDGFYRGRTAALFQAEMQRGGGIITREDLARYDPVWRDLTVAFSR